MLYKEVFPLQGSVSRRSRAVTAKKCTQKSDARDELFCSLNLLLFCRFCCRCRRRRRRRGGCLSSLYK